MGMDGGDASGFPPEGEKSAEDRVERVGWGARAGGCGGGGGWFGGRSGRGGGGDACGEFRVGAGEIGVAGAEDLIADGGRGGFAAIFP